MDLFSILLKIASQKPVLKTILAVDTFFSYLKKHWYIWCDFIFAKLLVLTLLGMLMAYLGWQRSPQISWATLAAIVLCCSAGAIIAGYVDYKIAKYRIGKRTLAELNSPPLSQFLENGFEHRFNDQLWGKVNNYHIIMIAAHGSVMDMMTIRIPISTEKGWDEITREIPPYFKIVNQNFIWVAKAEIENYRDKFNYFELMNIITQATEKMQQLEMAPFEFSD